MFSTHSHYRVTDKKQEKSWFRGDELPDYKVSGEINHQTRPVQKVAQNLVQSHENSTVDEISVVCCEGILKEHFSPNSEPHAIHGSLYEPLHYVGSNEQQHIPQNLQ